MQNSYSTLPRVEPAPYGLTSNVITVPMLGHENAAVREYPLYDKLVENVSNDPVTVNATNMANIINQIADVHTADFHVHYREILRLCIHHAVLHHQYQPNPNSPKKLPYYMRTMNSGRGVLVVVGDLPGPLVQIIDAYLNGKY